MQAAGLEHRVEIGGGQLVKAQFQVDDMLAGRQPQGIQLGLLVAALAVGGDQLHHAYLLALVLGGLGIVLHGGFGAYPHLADLGKAVAHYRMWHVLHLHDG